LPVNKIAWSDRKQVLFPSLEFDWKEKSTASKVSPESIAVASGTSLSSNHLHAVQNRNVNNLLEIKEVPAFWGFPGVIDFLWISQQTGISSANSS
jgi:hypothetical protein